MNLTLSQKKKWLQKIRRYIIMNLLIATGIVFYLNPNHILNLEIFRHFQIFVFSFLMSFALSFGIYQIVHITDQKISWLHYPLKRFFVELISVSTYAFVVSYILSSVYVYFFFGNYHLQNFPWIELLAQTKLPIIISLGITAFMTSRSFLLDWRKEAIASEKIRADRFQGQFQSLKDQLNPHFLFNSLNTLTNLVYQDQEKAAQFIQQLSRVYRYLLEVQQEELVTLEEEVQFANNYLGLQKLRFGDNLRFSINYLSKTALVPPLTLQLLLENAIKHNVISQESPLIIEVMEKEEMLEVQNSLRRKITFGEESTGVGLQNINARLAYFKTELQIVEANEYFLVKVPLLKSNEHANLNNRR